jgi:hypothetical protein
LRGSDNADITFGQARRLEVVNHSASLNPIAIETGKSDHHGELHKLH